VSVCRPSLPSLRCGVAASSKVQPRATLTHACSPDVWLNATAIATAHGYPCEDVYVTTDDGELDFVRAPLHCSHSPFCGP
jgi:hypothetical protein